MLTTRGNGKTIQETTVVDHMARDCKAPVAATNQRAPMANQKVVFICFECGKQGHYKSECPKLKNQTRANQIQKGKSCGSFNVVKDKLAKYHAVIVCDEKTVQIKNQPQVARECQKNYTDVRHKPLEFQVEVKVILKVSPWKGVIRFGKRRKLNPHYIGPFKILTKKCLSDETLAIPLDEIPNDDKLHFIEEPVEIMNREVKRLKQSRLPIVNV
ncbi:putative reverse transcriptase domain-containing protein [Tanacetum coccineum]